jgi:hypothetical protein
MKAHFSLDKNASSVTIALPRKGRRRVEHDYEVEYRGRIIRCKTAEAMTRLVRVIAQEDRPKDDIPWNDHDFSEFTERIRIPQRRLLKILVESKSAWMTDSELRGTLTIRNNQALAGVLSGVSKVALALDIEPGRVYVTVTKYEKGKPFRLYRIAPAFRKIAQEHDWPSKEDLIGESEEDY